MTTQHWMLAAGLVGLVGCGARAALDVDGTSTSGSGASTSTSSTGTGGGAGSGGASTSTSTSTGGANSGGGPACQPGDPPVALVSGQMGNGISAIALDASFVYFENQGGGCQDYPRLGRVPKHGGAVTIVGSTQRTSAAIAVDGANVYFSDDPVDLCTAPNMDAGFQIVALPKGGGGKPLTFAFGNELHAAADIALDDAYVYWLAYGADGVRRAPKGGGQPQTVSDPGKPAGVGLALFGDSVFWTSDAGVASAPKTGGTPVPLATALPQSTMGGIAVDATGVYFVGASPCQGADCGIIGWAIRVPLGGGSEDVLASGTEETPQRVAIDDAHVYWTLSKKTMPPALAGAVMRADKAGGNVVTIASGQAPTGIAIDDSCVYWGDFGDGSVWRAPK